MSAAAAALWSCDVGSHVTGIAWVLALASVVGAPFLLQYYPFSLLCFKHVYELLDEARDKVDAKAPLDKKVHKAERQRARRAAKGKQGRPEDTQPSLSSPEASTQPPALTDAKEAAEPTEAVVAAEPREAVVSTGAAESEEFFDPEPVRQEARQGQEGPSATEADTPVVAVEHSPGEESASLAEPVAGSSTLARRAPSASLPPSSSASSQRSSARGRRRAAMRHLSAKPCVSRMECSATTPPRRSASCPLSVAGRDTAEEELDRKRVDISLDSLPQFRRRSSASSSTSTARSTSRLQEAERRANLEDKLAACERELEVLETRLLSLVVPHCFENDSESLIGAWRTDCQDLAKRLGDVAADALECGCNRDTTGAMDVFQQANTAVDRMAGLLRKCSDAQVEAHAPESCDPVEWRLVARFVNNRLELESLRALMGQVRDCSSHPAGVSQGGWPLSRQPATLLRFLRAKGGGVDEAAEMFRTSLEWRLSSAIKEWNMMWSAEMSAAATWRARLVNQYQVHRDLGVDRTGLPVYLFRWSVFDIAGAERELGQEVVIRIILSIHEEILAAMRRVNAQKQTLAPGALYVWDVGNYGRHGVPHWWTRMWALVRFLPRVAKLLESNYPEVIRKIIVVRCGPATKALYRAVAPLMPSRTLRKCNLYGWRAAEWLQDLRQEMPEGDLPAFLERDDDDALASASPKGGIYPPGAAAAAQAAAEAHMATARMAAGQAAPPLSS